MKSVSRQIRTGLADFTAEELKPIVIAYEPVWAIGTGRAATGEVANAVVREIIRPVLTSMFGEEMAQNLRVQYGGSVTAANAAEFFNQPDIDGALVGGASLKPLDFIQIMKAAVK